MRVAPGTDSKIFKIGSEDLAVRPRVLSPACLRAGRPPPSASVPEDSFEAALPRSAFSLRSLDLLGSLVTPRSILATESAGATSDLVFGATPLDPVSKG